jgi:predicted phage tail protein
LYCKFTFDVDAFPNGVPEVSAVIKGKKVYDPRNTTTAWSDNPALCVRDYLTATGYGLGEATANVNDTSFITAANICDETNTDAGTTRYTANGAFTTGIEPQELLNDLMTSLVHSGLLDCKGC